MTRSEIEVIRELLALRRAGAIAAVYCDAGVLRVVLKRRQDGGSALRFALRARSRGCAGTDTKGGRMSALQEIDLGNSTPLPLPRKTGWPEAANPDSRIGWHCAKTPGSRNTNTGTHTQPNDARRARRAWVSREVACRKLPLEPWRRPVHTVAGSEIRAGRASLHRCKWREGRGRHPAPENFARKVVFG